MENTTKLNQELEPYYNNDLNQFISELSSTEKKAMEIAKNILKSSFNIEKSNGFKIYNQNKKRD
tara:strand:+ start:6265 stop:6456 length:192 start_codon:yes stop_codon:yes gene_type:complete